MTIIYKQNGSLNGTDFINKSDENRPLAKLRENRGLYVDPQDYAIDFDDFLGDSLHGYYSGAKGTDAQGVAPTVETTGALRAKGHMLMTCGDTIVVAESISSLTKGLNYRPSYGTIYMKTAIVLDAITNVSINVGFSDTLATTTLEEPFSISGTTITSNATDAVCFVFDTAQTNDFFHCQGVKADVDTAILNTGIAPVANTTVILEIEIDTAGHAKYWINNVLVGTVANAVTATALLTPIFTIMARTTAVRTLYADYLFITQTRSNSVA
jgi:hypothetical protein